MKNKKWIVAIVLIIMGAFMLLVTTGAIAQNNKVYSVDESMLTEQQKATLEAKESTAIVDAQIDQVSKYAGLGNEIGDAMEGALGAVKDNSIEMAESDLGKFVMMLVGWKVLWIHVLRIGVGVFIFLIATILFSFSYFKTLNKWSSDKHEYGISMSWAAAVHWILWMGTVIACGIIMFA